MSEKNQWNIVHAKKNLCWNPSKCIFEINLLSVIDDLVITDDEIINVLDTVLVKLNDEKATSRLDNYPTLLSLSLVTILLL